MLEPNPLYLGVFGENNPLGKYIQDDEIPNLYEIYNPHGLIQLIGYAKYQNRDKGPVFFRGQTENYESMRPTLYRKIDNIGTAHRKFDKLHLYIDTIKDKAFINNTLPISYAPILQHYGINTDWIDIVDNLWDALWFSSHQSYVNGKYGKYVSYEESTNKYSYIYIMYFGERNYPISKGEEERIRNDCVKPGEDLAKLKPPYGYFETNEYCIIDLRYMAPSLYRRPHAQHALLARRKSISAQNDIKYNDTILATLRINTNLVLKWIGKGIFTESSFMFPSPAYDEGYRLLIEKAPLPPKGLGCITIY